MVALSGCTKSSDSSATDDASKFAGTWTGTSCGSPSTFTLTKTSSTSLTTSGSVGVSTCVKAALLNHTVSGNVITVPVQTFADNCGNTYTISGGGTLSGNTLTLTETVVGPVSATCTFVGTK
jgi:hypothetical protein